MRSVAVPEEPATSTQAITSRSAWAIDPLQYIRVARGWPAVTYGTIVALVLGLFTLAALLQGNSLLPAILLAVVVLDGGFIWYSYRGIKKTHC